MATTAVHLPANNSKHYMCTPTSPSPPEPYGYSRGLNLNTAVTPQMANTPPSAGVSPTNYHAAANVRHIRQPRQPLSIPACLRPVGATDIPNRPRSLDTPPASKDNSFDSAKSHDLERIGLPSRGSASDAALAELRRGLSRAGSESVDEEFGEVTGPPTSAHWKPDESAADCAVCHQNFSWFFRRHHCRRCGDVVCGTHSMRVVPLDQNARLHPDGQRSKACDPCADEWRVIKHLRLSRASSIAESPLDTRNEAAAPALAIPQNAQRVKDSMRIGSMARSEGGMVWSTF